MDNHRELSHSLYHSTDLPLSVNEVGHGVSSQCLISGASAPMRFLSLTDAYYCDQDHLNSLLVSDNMDSHILNSQPMIAAVTTASSPRTMQDVTLSRSTRIEGIRLVTGQLRPAEICEKHKIRWKVCKKCDSKDETPQEGFKSELVLGVAHCLCSTTEHQKQHVDHFCSNVTNTNSRHDITHQDNNGSSLPIPESHSHSSAKMIVNGVEYFTS